jgi:hypothetical protein
MTRRLAVAVLFWIAAASDARGADWFGADGAYVDPIGKSADFAETGTSFEIRWRHYNDGRSALEVVGGYVELGLGGEVQSTIDGYEQLVRTKNQLAQFQGGPGNGFIIAEFGVFRTHYIGANLLFHPIGRGRVAPFVSFGAGGYRWRSPFRIKFYRTPFFGEQRAYDAPATGGNYAGVVAEDQIDFTKTETSGGVNGGVGISLRVTTRLMLDATVRSHLVFTSGRGNREEGIDDQDYLDDVTFLVARGGINFRF